MQIRKAPRHLDSRYVFGSYSALMLFGGGLLWLLEWRPTLAACVLIGVGWAAVPLGRVREREVRSQAAGWFALGHLLLWYIEGTSPVVVSAGVARNLFLPIQTVSGLLGGSAPIPGRASTILLCLVCIFTQFQ